jgi:hypothetical protein
MIYFFFTSLTLSAFCQLLLHLNCSIFKICLSLHQIFYFLIIIYFNVSSASQIIFNVTSNLLRNVGNITATRKLSNNIMESNSNSSSGSSSGSSNLFIARKSSTTGIVVFPIRSQVLFTDLLFIEYCQSLILSGGYNFATPALNFYNQMRGLFNQIKKNF